MRGGVFERLLRHEADNLAPSDRNAARRRLTPHYVEHLMQWSLLEIGEIHGHLSKPTLSQRQSQRLHERHSAGRSADCSRDFLRHLHVVGLQINIERDQQLSRSDDGSPRRWMERRPTQIRRHVRTLEAPTPAILEVAAIWTQGCSLIKIHRDSQPPPNLF